MSKTNRAKQERAVKLIESIGNGDREEANKLLKEGVDFGVVKGGDCPIHYAARKGDTFMLELLLTFKDNPNRPNENKNTPVHLATREGHLAAVQFLKGKNADLNGKNEDGDTPLHAAVIMQSMDFIEMVASLGMKVNETNKQGQTPLHAAVMHSRQEAMEALLYKRTNPAIRDKQGKTAADVANTPGIEKQLRTYAALLAAKDSGFIKAQGTSVNPKKVMELRLDRVDIIITSIKSKELLPFKLYCRREKTENSDIVFGKEESEEVLSDIFLLRVTDVIGVVNLEIIVPLYSAVKPKEQAILKVIDKDTVDFDKLTTIAGRMCCTVNLVLRPNTDETFVFYTKPKIEELIVSGNASSVQSKLDESFQLEWPANTFSADTKLTLKVYEDVSLTPKRKRKLDENVVRGKNGSFKKAAKEPMTETNTEIAQTPAHTNEPALLSGLYEINVQGTQPTQEVTVQCPANKQFDDVPQDDVIIVTADENNLKDETSLQVVKGTPTIVNGNFVFNVSHFSTYVPVRKSIFEENPLAVYKQVMSAKRREQPAVFFVMVLEKVDGESNVNIVVIEVVESRKVNTRIEFWQRKGYKPQMDGESNDLLTEPNQEFTIEISGNVIVDGADSKRKLAFMPRRASSQPFRVSLNDTQEMPTGDVTLVPIVNENASLSDLGMAHKEIKLSFILPVPPRPMEVKASATKFDPAKTDLKGPMIQYLKTVFYKYPWIDQKIEIELRRKIEELLNELGVARALPVMVRNTISFCKRTFDDWRERVFYSLIHNEEDKDTAALPLRELCSYVLADFLPPGEERGPLYFMIMLRSCAHDTDAFIKSTSGTKRLSAKTLPVTNLHFWRELRRTLENEDTFLADVMENMILVETKRIERYQNTFLT